MSLVTNNHHINPYGGPVQPYAPSVPVIDPANPSGVDDKQAKLSKDVDAYVNWLKDTYGDHYTKTIWNETGLKSIAEKGEFHSEKLGQTIKVPDHIREAVKNIQENGGAKLFDRGRFEEGKFNYEDLHQYTYEHPVPKNPPGNGGVFRDEGAMIHVRESSGHNDDIPGFSLNESNSGNKI